MDAHFNKQICELKELFPWCKINITPIKIIESVVEFISVVGFIGAANGFPFNYNIEN